MPHTDTLEQKKSSGTRAVRGSSLVRGWFSSNSGARVFSDGKNSPLDLVPRALGFLIHGISREIANRRLLVLQPFFMISGILVYRAARYEPAPAAMAAIAVFLLAGACFSRNRQGLLSLFVVLLGFWGGFLLLPIHGKLFGSPMVYGAIYGQFSARVDAIHSKDLERARIIISQITPTDGRAPPDLRRARILLPTDQLPGVGDIIEAPMRLYKVPGPVVPGGYDSQFQAYFKGIGAYGSTTGPLSITEPARNFSLARNIQQLRDFIGTRIDLALAPGISGIARALIIGDQSQIDEEVRKRLANAGLAHVLAISGLHLSLVAGGIFFAIRMFLALFYGLSLRINVKKIAATGGIIAALAYLALSGASVSAIRATLMLILIFGAVLAGRRALTMRNVAFAALFLIIMDPSSVFRPGFQLSFAAVVGLVGAYEGYNSRFFYEKSPLRKFFGFFGGIAMTSLVAGIATALFAAYHFQQVAPLGVFANIIAIPLVAFVVLPAAFLGVVLVPLGMETASFAIMGWGIEQIIMVANYISSLGEGYVSAPILGGSSLILALLAMAWFAFFTGRIRFAGIIAALFLVPLFGTMPPPDIMISDSTQAVAIRKGSGMELLAGRPNSFATNAWSQTYMTKVSKPEQPYPCDISGCWFSSEKFDIALVKGRDAFLEDCAKADLVIARIRAPENCRSLTQVIDSTDLQTGGVHWGLWDGSKFVIRAAIKDEFRPWRPQYPARQNMFRQ